MEARASAMAACDIYPEHRLVVTRNTNARLDDFDEFMEIEQAISRLFLARPTNSK